ncbi:hypothetical protein [Roseomonas sp. WA12]
MTYPPTATATCCLSGASDGIEDRTTSQADNAMLILTGSQDEHRANVGERP